MFEKEVEEYWYDSGSNEFDIGQVEKACKQSFKDGAEFAYNKANEWHCVKGGDLPKGKGVVLIYWKSGDVNCVSVVEPYKVTEDTHIIAWKEIVLPELKED